jgi:hypothetical protein
MIKNILILTVLVLSSIPASAARMGNSSLRSECGKVVDIRIPSDRFNNHIQSISIVTRTEYFAVQDPEVIKYFTKVLYDLVPQSSIEDYLYKPDGLNHFSNEGFEVCLDGFKIDRTWPHPITEKVRNFSIINDGETLLKR